MREDLERNLKKFSQLARDRLAKGIVKDDINKELNEKEVKWLTEQAAAN